MRTQLTFSSTIALFVLMCIPSPSQAAGTLTSPASYSSRMSSPTPIVKGYGSLPLQFEQNVGQNDSRVKYLNRSSDATLFLTNTDAVLCLTKRIGNQNRLNLHDLHTVANVSSMGKPATVVESVVRMKAVGANAKATILGMAELSGKVNYFIGNNPKKWHTNIATFKEVKYRDIYKNVDLAYYGTKGHAEYDFIVRPGGDPHNISLAFTGAKTMTIASTGDMILATDAGNVVWRKPVVYQECNGRRDQIEGSYIALGGGRVRFNVAHYDASLPLVIDPILVYSTYLGGNNDDQVNAIAADSSGCAYVTGQTYSPDFPVTSGSFHLGSYGYGSGTSLNENVFVSKFNHEGSALIYSTYLGGNPLSSEGYAVAVDSTGHAFVTGRTEAPDFPVSQNAFQSTLPPDNGAAFVVKLSPLGTALDFSTFIGSTSPTVGFGTGIAVDGDDRAYIVGLTNATTYPVTLGAFSGFTGDGEWSAVVSKLNRDGTGLMYSTYVGNVGAAYYPSIAVDQSGHAFIAGTTISSTFPTTYGAYQTKYVSEEQDGYIAKINENGTALDYSTFLGSNAFITGVAVDPSSNAYVTGYSTTLGFPVTPGAFETVETETNDAFVTKLNSTGTSLVYSTLLGGFQESTGTGAYAISVDSVGCAYVAGTTTSTDFPVTKTAVQDIYPSFLENGGNPGPDAAFLCKLNDQGTKLVYSTFFGGGGTNNSVGNVSNAALSVALDPLGNAYIAGGTSSLEFPITDGSVQTTYGGYREDGFVAKLRLSFPAISSFAPSAALSGSPVVISGSGFTGVNAVTLHGSAVPFVINSDDTITATIPVGAVLGHFVVAKTNESATSSNVFVVAPSVSP